MTIARYVWPRSAPAQREVGAWEFTCSPMPGVLAAGSTDEGDAPSPDLLRGATWHPAQAFPDMVQWECFLAGMGRPDWLPAHIERQADTAPWASPPVAGAGRERASAGTPPSCPVGEAASGSSGDGGLNPAPTPAPGHPYVGANSQGYLWAQDVLWWMRTTIPVGALDADASRAELVLDGVDHDVWMWVDGRLVGNHQGMFGGPVLDVSDWLAGPDRADHEVLVALRPVGSGRGKEIGWGTTGRLVKAETFGRWVNNPDLMTCGIWQPVRLVQTGAFRLERPRVTTHLEADGSATVAVEVEVLRADVSPDLHWVQRHGGVPPTWDDRFIDPGIPRLAPGIPSPSSSAQAVRPVGPDRAGTRRPAGRPSSSLVADGLEVTVTCTDPAGTCVAGATTTVDPTPGRVWARVELSVPDPELWWPAGTAPAGAGPARHTIRIDLRPATGPGEPDRTDVPVRPGGTARRADPIPLDHLDVPTGLREIRWERADGPRLADHWLHWRLSINGRDVTRGPAGTTVPVRGVNWMPQDLLRQDPVRTRHFLTLMRDAGVQLVRVWGGGLVETEDFYDLCDELGLLVWQDFPLNTLYDCSTIPLDVWEQQATWTVERLRNRASLAVWCGGNELDPYAPENAAVIGVLERTLRDLDGTRPFVRSCSDPGDVHPYLECDTTWYRSLYRDVPAISEWGGHTLPTLSSLGEVLPADELAWPLAALTGADPAALPATHPTLRHHWAEFQPDRVPRMLQRARIHDDLASPGTSFIQGVEAIQLGAAEIYQTVLTDFSCGDTAATLLMAWVYNRPWPSVGMQAVDHSGRPTLGYFAIRRASRPGAIVLRPEFEALAPGEPLHLSVGLTLVHEADSAPGSGGSGTSRAGTPSSMDEGVAEVGSGGPREVEVAVYDQSLRELARERVRVAPGPDGWADLTVEIPVAHETAPNGQGAAERSSSGRAVACRDAVASRHAPDTQPTIWCQAGPRSLIVIATDVADPSVQHVRVVRVSESLADTDVRAAYRSHLEPSAHFMDGSLREAVEAVPAAVLWSVASTDSDADAGRGAVSVVAPDRGDASLGISCVLTCENTGDIPAAVVQVESVDPLWMVLPEDSGFWIPPHTTRRLGVRVRPTAEVSTIVMRLPDTGSEPADAITVRGWNL